MRGRITHLCAALALAFVYTLAYVLVCCVFVFCARVGVLEGVSSLL